MYPLATFLFLDKTHCSSYLFSDHHRLFCVTYELHNLGKNERRPTESSNKPSTPEAFFLAEEGKFSLNFRPFVCVEALFRWLMVGAEVAWKRGRYISLLRELYFCQHLSQIWEPINSIATNATLLFFLLLLPGRRLFSNVKLLRTAPDKNSHGES